MGGEGHSSGKVKVKSLSHVRLFVTPWDVAYQASLSMGFSRQGYWNGLPLPSPGDLPNPGIEPSSPTLQADALSSEPPGGDIYICTSWCTAENTTTSQSNRPPIKTNEQKSKEATLDGEQFSAGGGGDFATTLLTQGYVAMFRNTLSCNTESRGAIDIKWVEPREAA